MKKRLTALLLVLLMILPLSACRGDGKYCVAKGLDDVSYSIVLRNGDSTYHYIYAALCELEAEGKIDQLANEWFGDKDIVDFPSGSERVEDFGYIEPRTFTIGVDPASFPMYFTDMGAYSGFDGELALAVCEKLGWYLRVQEIKSEDAFVELNSGNIDCAWGGISADLSSTDYTVLCTYMTTEVVIAGMSNGKSTLSGGVLYLTSGNVLMNVLNENERSRDKLGQITRVHGTVKELFTSMANGDCDFILTTEAAVLYMNRH